MSRALFSVFLMMVLDTLCYSMVLRLPIDSGAVFIPQLDALTDILVNTQ